MEKVKISGPMHPEYYHYEWKLTEDEKENLREILKDFKNHCVKDFIAHFEYLCQCVMVLSDENETYKRPSKENRKVKIKDTVKILNQALKEIKRIKRFHIEAAVPYDLIDLFEEKAHWIDSPGKTQSLAIGIERDLTELIDIFKSSPDLQPKRGNPTIRESFGAAIASAYMEHIGRPTTTISRPNSRKGQFYDILSFAFEIVGLPSIDVSKTARAVCPKRGYKHTKKAR